MKKTLFYIFLKFRLSLFDFLVSMRTLLTVVFIFFCYHVNSQVNEKMLFKLDSVIQLRDYYKKEKLKSIDRLKYRLEIYQSDKNYPKEYNTYLDLFYEYQSFVYDSAYFYIQKAKDLATKVDNPSWKSYAQIKQGFVLLSSGLFKEAIDLLEDIDVEELSKEKKAEYYSIIGRAYYDLADFGNDPNFLKTHKNKGNTYLDSAIFYSEKNTNQYWANISLLRMKQDDWRGAKHAFSYWLNNYKLPKHYQAIATSSLGYIYSMTGVQDKAIDYLILAAISDIRTATKETVALRNLSKILFDLGYKKRAYNYIILALENATYYNARHRKIEIASILPIIEGERLSLLENQKSSLIWLTTISGALSLFVLVFIVVIYLQLKKLKMVRKTLQVTVDNLSITNKDLRLANKIKEEYIGYFFDINSEYINKIDALQKNVLRKINLKQYDDIIKLIKGKNIRNERQFLYHRFDEIFLKIFPDFIKQYNNLFSPEDRTVLKPDELLNSELRIFGLIRLGVSDNEKIAKFLNLTVTTIYTYKTKAKARAINKEIFFEDVMGIKAVK